MLQTKQILVRVALLASGASALIACGQPGALYLPTEPAAAQRATLPQSLLPAKSPGTAASPTPAPTASPSTPTAPAPQ